MSTDGQLSFAFAKLDEALQEVEIHRLRAMPAHEREAKFASARLEIRLHDQAEQDALATFGLRPAAGRRLYRLRPGSVDVKLRVDDFTVALVPENQPLILDRTLGSVVFGSPLQDWFGDAAYRPMEKVLSVRITGLDRDRNLVCIDLNPNNLATIDALAQHGLLELERDVVLDPTYSDS